jgi:toxin ParE1/3/4
VKIRWSPEAAEHLSEIHHYLEQHRPSLADSTIRELFEGISALEQVPYRGRPGKRPSTRELVFPDLPYVAVYRIKDEFVEIVRIRHTSRRPILH